MTTLSKALHVALRERCAASPAWASRRARLEDVVTGDNLIFAVRRLAPDGLEAWAQVVARGYEGFVAKDEASPSRWAKRVWDP